jgi:glycosyltransferase involved in cell wall biosynthesis
MRICTIIATNYLAHARVLARSVASHNPGARLAVLVVDADRDIDASHEPFDLVAVDDLELDRSEFHQMAAIYDVTEFSTAVKPWLLRALLRRGAEVACYLDPDIQVFAPLEHVEPLARNNGIVLIPHTTSPMPRDGMAPGEREILLAGVFNLGFIAVSQSADGFLGWWCERLRRDCRVDVASGLFVDQRWIDFVPGYFEHSILTDPGYNVAYWNLYAREVRPGGPTGYLVNGCPLRFFHFSGFSALEPWRLSRYQGKPERIRLDQHPVLARLCHRYATQLIEQGYLECVWIPYGFGQSVGGLPIDSRVRRAYREDLLRSDRGGGAPPPDPFYGADADRFRDWISLPQGGEGASRLSRYTRAIWDERPDIRAHFGTTDSGFQGYVEWLVRYGRSDAALPPVFSPPLPSLPKSPLPSTTPQGVNVVGYLTAELGVGEVARGLLDVLAAAQVPHAGVPCVATANRLGAWDGVSVRRDRYDLNLVCINADELPMLAHRMGESLPPARRTAGVWAWEVAEFPEWMRQSARLVDEIWALSAHTAAAIAPVVDVPVAVVPPPIRPVIPELVTRADLRLPEGFLFLFCFDFYSVFERKNALGTIEAFRRAFDSDEGARLVVKSINGRSFPAQLARLKNAAAKRPDIRVVDGYLPPQRQRAVMASCDAYVSLHRAEGFGLTLGEAMALGKPVIATGYSGNLEFMNPGNSLLVPYDLVAIPRGCDPYPVGTPWAAPDLDAAAAMMRRLVDDPGAAAVLGRAAQKTILEKHGPEARVAMLKKRLERLREERA